MYNIVGLHKERLGASLICQRNTCILLADDVIPWVFKKPHCNIRSPLMKTLDWSVETLGLDYNSTGLCTIYLNQSSERNMIVASCQQAVDIFSTSWEQVMRTQPVDKLLEQHCYNESAAGRSVTTCAFLRVYTRKNAQADLTWSLFIISFLRTLVLILKIFVCSLCLWDISVYLICKSAIYVAYA
jgi:hypothetical protein